MTGIYYILIISLFPEWGIERVTENGADCLSVFNFARIDHFKRLFERNGDERKVFAVFERAFARSEVFGQKEGEFFVKISRRGVKGGVRGPFRSGVSCLFFQFPLCGEKRFFSRQRSRMAR